VGDAVLLRKAAGVDEPPFRRRVFQRQAEVDAGSRRRFDLGDDVLAIDGDDGFAGRDADVVADRSGQFVESIVERAEGGF